MTNAIGIVITDHIVAGRLEDKQLKGKLLRYPADPGEPDILSSIPVGELVRMFGDFVTELAGENAAQLDAIGIAVPGIVRHGNVEDSPNLTQMKGVHLGEEMNQELARRGMKVPVCIANDADAIAAGVAALYGRLEKLTRVWTIGNGIGYGRWPYVEGVWEGGHITVTLDPKERFCGCGGQGHLEGIMGHRAMRLRFLDMEPEEVFENARKGDQRCRDFVDLWHRALAAATASFIHLAGPGKFYFTGINGDFLELPLLRTHIESMVKLSPLQSFSLEILPPDDRTAVIGVGVTSLRGT